jgi:hypothetical protein
MSNVNVKIELEIAASRLINQVNLNNKELEDVIKKAIQEGVEEELKENNLKTAVKEVVKEKIRSNIYSTFSSYETNEFIKNTFRFALKERIYEVVSEINTKDLLNLLSEN